MSIDMTVFWWGKLDWNTTVRQVEVALQSGTINADLKEKFKKLVAKIWSSIRKKQPNLNPGDERYKTAPELKVVFERDLTEDDLPVLLAGYRKLPEDRGLTRWVESLATTQQLLQMRRDVETLTVEGEVTRKEKPTFSIPNSPNFKNGEFLQWYTPKLQEAIVAAVREIDAAISEGYAERRRLRSWEALFGKYEKARAAFRERAGSGLSLPVLHTGDPHEDFWWPRIQQRKPDVKAFVDDLVRQFSDVRAVFEKLEKIATSKKAHQQDVMIKRDWSPAADTLKKRLQEIVRDTIEDLEENLFQQYYSWRHHQWLRIQKAGVKNFHEWQVWWRQNARIPGGKITSAPHDAAFWDNQTLVASFPEKTVTDESRQKAHRDAQEIGRQFIDKNMFKLTSLLKTKTMTDIKITRLDVKSGAVHSEMRFSFDDQSAFTVKNQIVWSVSPLGTQFTRYPTTFHNVVVRGKPMPTPSEVKVYLEFAGEKVPTEASFGATVKSRYSVAARKK